MAITSTKNNWVASDGSYGHGTVITFDSDDLSPRQWDVFEEQDEDNKFFYLQAILNGDPTTDWEETNE